MARLQAPVSALFTTNHLHLLEFNHDTCSRKLSADTCCPIYEQLADVTKYRLFCLDSLFFLSVPPSQDFLTSPTPFQPFGALVAALWLCRPGAQWSCRSEFSSGDTCVAMQMAAGFLGALTTPNIHAAWDLVVLLHGLVEGGMGEVPVSPYSSNQTPLIGRSCWGAHLLHPTSAYCSRSTTRYGLRLGRQQHGIA